MFRMLVKGNRPECNVHPHSQIDTIRSTQRFFRAGFIGHS